MIQSAIPRPVTIPPTEYFPHWPLQANALTADVLANSHVETVRIAVERLENCQVANGLSWQKLGEKTGVAFTIFNKVVLGTLWPRSEYLAACEMALDATLWPSSRHAVRRSLETLQQ